MLGSVWFHDTDYILDVIQQILRRTKSLNAPLRSGLRPPARNIKRAGVLLRENVGKDSACARWHASAGFSLVEIILVLMMAGILAGIGLIGSGAILPGIQANRSMHEVVAQLRNGREQAIAQRRTIQVAVQNGNQIRLLRQNIPASNGVTVLNTLTLGRDCAFRLYSGVPDSPDSFGNMAATDFGAAATVSFLPDGTLVDEAGNPVSGSLFFGIANRPETARAVTILGATGRVRSYRWTGESWIQ